MILRPMAKNYNLFLNSDDHFDDGEIVRLNGTTIVSSSWVGVDETCVLHLVADVS